MTGILLLLILSILFGLAFSNFAEGKIQELQLQLLEKDKEMERIKEQCEFEKKVLRNTIQELLRD